MMGVLGWPFERRHSTPESSRILMNRRNSIRALAIPVVLLALLVFAMTLGTVVHTHSGTSESNCSICHLNHQPIDQTAVVDSAPSFAQVGVPTDVAPPAEPQIQPARRLPARAPPAA
jgi:hypothetical protein